MCSSKTKLQASPNNVSQINGRPVLQPNRNRVSLLDRRSSLKKPSSAAVLPLPQPPSPPSPAAAGNKVRTRASVTTPPASPKIKSPRQPAVKRGTGAGGGAAAAMVDEPGSIAAARREHMAIMQVQRKMRIAHYGRTKSAKYDGKVGVSGDLSAAAVAREEKRCSFITPNSDPIYVAYHDEEWGVPVHNDNMLFELLVLSGAQVGSDWTIVLKKRQDFRDAFSGFDAEAVSKYTEKKMTSVSADYGIELSQVRGVVDNSIRILEVKKKFGSFDNYLWAFVNHKPIATQYKWCNKIPVKTSKSEAISKDMVKRDFRYVGPTVIHSFMQAAGLTNDHLTTCPRHVQCAELAAPQRPSTAPSI